MSMDDEIRPIQPIAPATPPRRPTPINEFRRRLGTRMTLIIERLRQSTQRRRRGPADPEVPQEDEQSPPGPDPDHHIDREA
jgi:hypothetical protein